MNNKITAYVGTYTNGESKGIYKFTLDLETGKIEDITTAAEVGNPTYLCIDRTNKFLYSVGKLEDKGGVFAYSIKDSGILEMINYQAFEGSPPCYVSLDKAKNYLFSANYHKGEISVFPLKADGSINAPSAVEKHEGFGPNKERQEKAHAHFVALAPEEKQVYAVDLGIDKVVAYDFNEGALSKSDKLTLTLNPGSGPRHMAFHPDNKFAYILTELSSEVIALEYSESEGKFNVLQCITALPKDFTGESIGSAIHISKDGNFLYTSNRGHDSIAVFSIDKNSGKLSFVQHVSTEGSGPRDFSLDPTGKYLIAANQNTSNIISFLISKETGKLTKVATEVNIPNPVCIKFMNL